METDSRRDVIDFDAVVIGGSINGSCAALHLVRSGKKTALLEQYPIPNNRSSSGGQSRIFRFAHSSFDAFGPIVRDSLKQWREIEKECNQSLLRYDKAMFISGKKNLREYDMFCSSIVKNGARPIENSMADVNRAYGLSFDEDLLHLEDPESGVLMASKSVHCIQGLFLSSGGTLLDEFLVNNISVSTSGIVTIEGLNKKIIKTKAVVICTGPWTNKLLKPLDLQIPITPLRVCVFYWPILDKNKKTFTFFDVSDPQRQMYGTKEIEYPGLFKIGYHGGRTCDPSERDHEDIGWNRKIVSDYIKKNFPWVGSTPAVEEPCLYTMTPDREMIIDQHPKYKNIAFATGFSGTGFKSGPTVGKILADLVVFNSTTFDISDYRLNRFNTKTRNPQAKL